MDNRVNKIIDLIENTVDEVSRETLQSYREKRLKEPLDKRTPTKTKGIQRSYTKMMYKINKDDKGTFGDNKGYDQGRYMGDSVEEVDDEVEESMVARVQGGRKMVSAEAALRHAREIAHKRQPGSKPTMSDIAAAHRKLTSGLKESDDLEEGLLSKIAGKVMGVAPKEPKYKVGQTVSYVTHQDQPGWDDRGRGKGKITNYSNGHYTVNGKPINHFEIKKLHEKTLTPAELKKREEVAKALERDDPSIDIGKKMAIATNVAKRVAETELDESFAVKDSSGKTVDVKFSDSEAKKRAEELTKKTGQKHSVKFERTAMVRTVKEDTDGKDTVTLEIPALIRALEWAREDAKSDVEIHKFVEKLINHEGAVDMKFFSEDVIPSTDRKIDKTGRPYPAHRVQVGTNESETLKVGETVWAKDQKLSYKTHTGKILSISKETVTIKLKSGATQTFPKKAVSSDFETLNPNPRKRADESIEESKVSSTYEISYDYGPHMSKTVSISANSEKEAEKEVIRTAAKEGHRNIMINWIRKDARQSIQRGTNAK